MFSTKIITIPVETNLEPEELLEIVQEVILGDLGDRIFEEDPGCCIDEDEATIGTIEEPNKNK
jgi:hypothetical protein